ncbi:MAG: hypothetical protein K2X32_10695 [Phycisphaerales bacterium]|nr:hypothetical protein [Phycisphaerales bacterium]
MIIERHCDLDQRFGDRYRVAAIDTLTLNAPPWQVREFVDELVALFDRGCAEAAHLLGDVYSQRLGAQRDPKVALMWHRKAAKQRYAPSLYRVSHLLHTGAGSEDHLKRADVFLRAAAALGYPPACYTHGGELVQSDNRQDRAEGEKLLRHAVNGGMTSAKLVYAAALERWEIDFTDEQIRDRNLERLAVLQSAAEDRDPRGMAEHGFELVSDASRRTECELGVQWLRRAIELGSSNARFFLVQSLWHGIGCPQNRDEALTEIRTLADADHPGVFRWIYDHLTFPASKDLTDAHAAALIAVVQEASNRAVPAAMKTHGELLYRGVRLPEDRQAGLKLLRQAAAAGDALANLTIVYALENENLQPADEREAAMCIRRAAEHGHRTAMALQGRNLERGTGVPVDVVESRRWLERAARDGSPFAARFIGESFLNDASDRADYRLGMLWCRLGARLGDPQSMYALGWCLRWGNGTTKDHTAARHWLEKAAALDEPRALGALAEMVRDGDGGPVDLVRALGLFERAAALEDIEATYSLAYALNNWAPRDAARARTLYLTAAEAGKPEAMVNYAHMLMYSQGGEKDLTTAEMWLRRALKSDLVNAYHVLGVLLVEEVATPESIKEGLALFEVAISRGFTDSLNRLGDAYYHGWGLKRNMIMALRMYTRAVEAGDYTNLSFLGEMHAEGWGCVKDERRAMKYYALGIKHNVAACFTNMGFMYEHGRGVFLPRRAKAVEWYRKGAALGCPAAMANLGACYERGRGVRKNIAEARKWFMMAAEAGSDRGTKGLERLGGKG